MGSCSSATPDTEIPFIPISNSKTRTTNEIKHDNHIKNVLSTNGQLELPNKFVDWFPSNHGHKKVKKLFKFKSKIGNGTTSTLYSAIYKGKKCAIKKINRSQKYSNIIFITEARILKYIKHPGIIKLIDIYFDQKYFYLIMELADYDLYSMLQNHGSLMEDETKIIIKNLLESIQYLHSKNISHRDLKPENIVFLDNDTMLPKCIDFGEALLVNDEQIYDEVVGTPFYMSPERQIECKGWQLKKSDIWSIGVICYEMITGKKCFYGESQNEIFNKIKEYNWDWPKNIKPSQNCKKFIQWCLEFDAKDRPSCYEALQHPWITGI